MVTHMNTRTYPYAFYNEDIFAEVKNLMDGRDIPLKEDSFYSIEYGPLSHKRITSIFKSKFKVRII